MGARKKSNLNIYQDPQTEGDPNSVVQTDQYSTSRRLTDGDMLSVSSAFDVDDLQEVQLMDRTLGKRNRGQDRERSITRARLLHVNSDNISDSEEDQGRGSFRPSATQRRVSRSILHSRFQGKSPRYVLERMQQSNNAPFLRFPPVCRGLWEFGFLARGLTLMHCRPADLWDQRNTLRVAPAATSRSDVSGALRSLRIFAQEFYTRLSISSMPHLRIFAQEFYVDTVIDLIDAALTFVERYKGVYEADAVGWKLLAFWVTSKFGKFRSFIVSRDHKSSQEVQHEFSRTDEDLLELLDIRLAHRNSDHTPHAKRTSHDTTRRSERPPRQSSVPGHVLSALPRQGDKRLCMKWISAMGCPDNGKGGCFDSKRAHFRPASIPDIVLEFIKEKYNGLAPASNTQ
ncbi:LOW QUALITY PROTEIN: hypothetical protein PHMEG_00026087 [Phytophthora megakarya]|uniref:Uncharacterized protein n=1 Tax=Phytophthora megakarya TaxID=4795 RepID=A0A225VAJ9_9STRA|nr:LOW QUALITY PROTEIN: hypothetical protein PHMEG_00026087 [Phytophthora megakarya]